MRRTAVSPGGVVYEITAPPRRRPVHDAVAEVTVGAAEEPMYSFARPAWTTYAAVRLAEAFVTWLLTPLGAAARAVGMVETVVSVERVDGPEAAFGERHAWRVRGRRAVRRAVDTLADRIERLGRPTLP